MSAEIINFRQERRRRQREARAAEAAGNRVRFGRTRAERERDALRETQARRSLDGHLREGTEPSPADQSDDAAPGTPAPKSP
ncbi:MAG TPA: DUF4169 family protein [Hyphomicrobiaceae bacterium]|jgi:hypothetical protein|nr:DUF4169 family protein [Hyphomicrobiaceae bacterium]